MNAIATRLARGWLYTGVLALSIAGLLSILLVVARAMKSWHVLEGVDLFGITLVVHVDLSVLVWFLTGSAFIWQLMVHQKARDWHCLTWLPKLAIGLFAGGSLLMAASMFGGGAALKNNYVPVLENRLFFTSVGMVLVGGVFAALSYLGKLSWEDMFPAVKTDDSAIRFGAAGGAVVTMAAVLAFYMSSMSALGLVKGEAFYEIAFWGGGHILQFTYTQAMLIGWLWLLGGLGIAHRLPIGLLYTAFAVAPLCVLLCVFPYIAYDITSFEYLQFFTDHMIWFGGVAPLIIGGAVVIGLLRTRRTETMPKALYSSLMMSLLLFGVGGVFGILIDGPNVRIPAHYHGAIVGVTLSLMGSVYLWMPKLGFPEVARWRLAFWQPIVYGTGQLMHITGLAVSGGYDVLRKTPGGIENAPPVVKAAMGAVGGGGLIAIAGGVMFVLVVLRAWLQVRRSKEFA